jgi:hypothetical protein
MLNRPLACNGPFLSFASAFFSSFFSSVLFELIVNKEIQTTNKIKTDSLVNSDRNDKNTMLSEFKSIAFAAFATRHPFRDSVLASHFSLFEFIDFAPNVIQLTYHPPAQHCEGDLS